MNYEGPNRNRPVLIRSDPVPSAPRLYWCLMAVESPVPATHPKCPANARRSPNVGLMLAHRRRLWANIKPTLDQRNVFCLCGSYWVGVGWIMAQYIKCFSSYWPMILTGWGLVLGDPCAIPGFPVLHISDRCWFNIGPPLCQHRTDISDF